MVKLLVLADDFTGALDTGVQFRAKGTRIRFGSKNHRYFENLSEEVQVLIVDTESRHLPPEEAAAVVRQVVTDAVKAGVRYIYKKTDSGLRGNIGAELGAALEASNQSVLHFIPAYPQIGRTTVRGIHYIKGVPVGESVFANDPFNPVHFSRVEDVVRSQWNAEVAAASSLPVTGIVVHDAETEDDLTAIAARLQKAKQLQLLSGCAGFASVLPQLLELETAEDALPAFASRLLTICGSINPITLEQLDAAEAAGIPRVRLNTRQKLDKAWLAGEEGHAALTQWAELSAAHRSAIIECNGLSQPEELETLREELGLSFEQMRCQIADTMGSILKGLLDRGLEATLLVTGGDTLLAAMNKLGQEELIPIREITPGVVLSQIHYNGKVYNLLSKSGGFGTKELLAELENRLCNANP